MTHVPCSVGYYKGQSRFWIRDDTDVKHVGTMFIQGNACTLWCDAVSQIVKKRKQKRDSDSSDELSDTDSKGKSKKKKTVSNGRTKRTG